MHFMVSKSDEEIYKKLIGENIRRIRKRQRMTQDFFAESIGIEPSNLSNIENGKSFPSALTIINIQKKFQISTEEIFDSDDFNTIKNIEKEMYHILEELDEKKKRLVWKIIKAID